MREDACRRRFFQLLPPSAPSPTHFWSTRWVLCGDGRASTWESSGGPFDPRAFALLFQWNNCDDCLVPEQTGLHGISQHSLLISCTIRFPLFPVSLRLCVPHCDAGSPLGNTVWSDGRLRWRRPSVTPERTHPWATATHTKLALQMRDIHSLLSPLPPRHYERIPQPPLSQNGHHALDAAFQAAADGFLCHWLAVLHDLSQTL